MECTLAALIACFSWQNLYLDSGIGYNDVTYYEFKLDTREAVAVPNNPFGRFAIGYQIEPSRSFRLSLDLTHQSSLHTNADRGVNAVWINARWFPFR